MAPSSVAVDRATSVWLQASGWLTVGVVYFVLDLPDESSSIPTLSIRALVWAALGWLSSRILLLVYERVRVRPRRVWTLVFGSITGALVGGTTWFILFNTLDWLVELEGGFVSPLNWHLSHLVSELITFVFPMLAWHGVVLSVLHWTELASARADAERAERLTRDVQLQMLRYQLNPHFLFNTLNSAIALVDVDGARAQTMLLQLCEVLRHTLRDRSLTCTVRDELASIRDYLAIESVRFEERLVVKESIDDAVLDELIPTLLLHPLVENAIKHGFERETQLALELYAHHEGGALVLEVINNGHLASESVQGHGIGIRNVRERLAASHPRRHEFHIEQDQQRVRARVVLYPLSGSLEAP